MSKKIKIAIIGPLPPPWMGPSFATEMILNSALKDKFQIIHLDTSDRRPLANIGKLDFRNITLALFHVFKLFSVLLLDPCPLVYLPISQSPVGFLRDAFFVIGAKITNAKVAVHLRGSNFRNMYEHANGFIKMIVRFVFNLVDAVIVLCPSVAPIFSGLVGPEKIKIVPNGLGVSQDSSNRCKPAPGTILYLSGLMRPKGFFDVIQSVPLVRDRIGAAVTFTFAGEWRSRTDQRQTMMFIEDHSIASAIHFSGVIESQERKREVFANADIFVFPPSEPEGQPWVLIEAMAAGLPIITTDQGCIREMVIDGENGFIVEKQHPEQIAEKIIILLTNRTLRRTMGRRSRERFLKYYTEDKCIGSLTRVFEELLLK